jgi:hypothetical protein
MSAPNGFYVHRWLMQFADLIDSIAGIFSFGFYHPNLGMTCRARYGKKRLRALVKKYSV